MSEYIVEITVDPPPQITIEVTASGPAPQSTFIDQATWLYDTVETMADPSTGKLRTNVPAGVEASQIAFSALSTAGINLANLLRVLKDGDLIYFQEADVAANWGRYRVSGPTVDNGTWFQVPVLGIGENGSGILKNQSIFIRFIYVTQWP
jgi:hypothetical protein